MKVSTKVYQPFNKEGLQCFAGFDVMWCWSTLPAEKAFQSYVIKLERNTRILLISGVNFEVKEGLAQDFNGDSLISCTKVAAENICFFVRGRQRITHDKSWMCSLSQYN